MPPVPPEGGFDTHDVVSRSALNPVVKDRKAKFTHQTKAQVYTQADVDEAVEAGLKLIIFEEQVYNITKWYSYHPGGELTLFHLIGKDATDHMVAFHPKKILVDFLPRFLVGKFKKTKISEEEEKVSASFKRLVKRIEDAGLHETDHSFFMGILTRCLLQLACSIASCLYLPQPYNAIIGGLFMAATWQQVAFFCHDAGHNGITHDRTFDYTLATCCASFIGGLSMAWWKDSHNVHHIITNHPHHDPDIQHLPVFAVSPDFFSNIKSTYHKRTLDFDFFCKLLVPVQHHLYFIINSFGRFLLYALSIGFVMKNEKREARDMRTLEITGMISFFTWYSCLVASFNDTYTAFLFILVSHLASSILHLQIVVSHFSMDTSCFSCSEHFAVKALRTTMDVECAEWFDFFHGGLQFQVIHHLFPRVPRHNLRRLKPFVEEFAKENGLKYETHSFVKGNMIIIGALEEIAQQCWFLMSHAGEKIHI